MIESTEYCKRHNVEVRRVERECGDCDGKGYVDDEICSKCQGAGTEVERICPECKREAP